MACNTYNDSNTSVDGLVCSADTVIANVMEKLRMGKIDTIDVNKETGEVFYVHRKLPFAEETSSDTDKPQLGSLSSQFVGAGSTTHMGDYSTDKVVGVELIVESIVREVLDHVVRNAEVAMKERMDKLESDFNTLVASLVTAFVPSVGITPPGAVTIAEYNLMVAGVQTALAAAGGTTREADTTTTLKTTNETINGIEVQIK